MLCHQMQITYSHTTLFLLHGMQYQAAAADLATWYCLLHGMQYQVAAADLATWYWLLHGMQVQVTRCKGR